MGLKWEEVKSEGGYIEEMCRAKVPGGWLTCVGRWDDIAITFYPDSIHHWDGSSLS
jgi:hypothetical protein